MIPIYSHSLTERLRYTLDVLFKRILQVDYKWVDKASFEKAKPPKINYSDTAIAGAIWIKPHSLLFETGITEQDIQVTYRKEIPYFFKTDDLATILFDIFAASFYMLSRYEEYLPFNPDKHGRFRAEASLAYKTGFLQKPVVHLWAQRLREEIVKCDPLFSFPSGSFTQLNTIDIDVAYACQGKPWYRRAGGFIKKIFHFYNQATWQTLDCKDGDPYDTYDVLETVQKETQVPSLYFFQVGKYGTYDKNLPLRKPMKQLIRRINTYAEIGIHPSYRSNRKRAILQKEVSDLSEVLGKKITKSRQHYLKMRLPETYENLITAGILEDYTMGFAGQISFRAGMAVPFPFFNLKLNQERPLLIVPFQLMDGTLKDYLKLSPEEALKRAEVIKEIVKQVKGQLVTIFHNSSLNDTADWKGWLAVYRELYIE